MKTKNLFTSLAVAPRAAWACLGVASARNRILRALIAVLNLMPAGRATAQTFTTLHSFTPYGDGANPDAGLITNSSGNTLYGTASSGGFPGRGTVFAVNTDGTGFTTLYGFSGGSDGAFPVAGLVLSGNTLYGLAAGGFGLGHGTVFAVNIDGTGFTNLHSFAPGAYDSFGFYTNSDGANPREGLILSGNTLYGTASGGGSSGNGVVFAINTDGTDFTTLHSFTALDQTYYTNSDGAFPTARLILSGSTLYGTAVNGGSSGNGTVFAVGTNGTCFTNLYSFTALPAPYYTNSDGRAPEAGLILSGNALYGTASGGGSSGNGTVFAVNTDGTAFTALHHFTALDQTYYTNSDGANPEAELIFSGNTLYGAAVNGGSSGNGTVFAVNTDGTGFTTLHHFTAAHTNSSGVYTNTDGGNPHARLILSSNTLYGTATADGSSGNGTVFSLSFRPQLTITPSGIPPSGIILSWPISYAGFSYGGYHLQETADLASQGGWISVVDTNLPVIVNGQIRVTTPMLGPQWSYRLAQ